MKKSLRPLYRRLQKVKIDVEGGIGRRRRKDAIPRLDLDGRGVLVLVVDCLRADHLSCAGYERETTPFLDAHGSFATAIAAAPWTYSSVPSILTGLYPHNHGAVYESTLRHESQSQNRETGEPPGALVDEAFTLHELVASAGYETYFATSIPTAEIPLRGRLPSPRLKHHEPASAMADHLVNWWDTRADSPRLGYVHFSDLHIPLGQPDRLPFGEIPAIEDLHRWRFTDTTEPEAEFERYREERIRLYDTHIRAVDRQIGRLYHHLEASGDLDDTVILVTGDHGEEFWERVALERERFYDPRGTYGVGHGHALVPEVTDVPIVALNGIDGFDGSPLSTVDIVPTVLSELGVRSNELRRFDGIPARDATADRVLLSEEVAYGYDKQAVVQGDHHLIHSPHEDQTVLLDRSKNRIVDDRGTIEELLPFTGFDRSVGDPVTVDESTKQLLYDLGYR